MRSGRLPLAEWDTSLANLVTTSTELHHRACLVLFMARDQGIQKGVVDDVFKRRRPPQ